MSTGLGLGLTMGRRMVSDGAPCSALAIMCFGDKLMSLDTNDDQLKLFKAKDGRRWPWQLAKPRVRALR